jgi:hypothetical protein
MISVFKQKHLARNITSGNVLLLAILLILTNYVLLPFIHVSIRYSLPVGKISASRNAGNETEHQVPSLSDYTVIADANLFHPERKIPADKKEEAPPLPKPDVVLYGTMISDGVSVAYLEDLKAPRNTAGRGERQLTMKKGDILSGFTLKEIETDKIVMVRGEEKLIVPVMERGRSKARKEIGIAGASVRLPGAAPVHRSVPAIRPPAPSKQQAHSSIIQAIRRTPHPPQPGEVPPRSHMDSEIYNFFNKHNR